MAGLEDWVQQTTPAPAAPAPADTTPPPANDGLNTAPLSTWYTGQADTAKLSLAMDAGITKDPQRAARILALEGKTGLPADLIDRNLDTVEAQATRSDFDAAKFRAQSPIVAGWMAEHPDQAALAKDDYQQLGFLERTVNSLKRGMVELSQEGSALNIMNRRYQAQQMARVAGANLNPQLQQVIDQGTGELNVPSIKNIVDKQNALDAIPQNGNVARAQNANSFSDFWYWFSRDPVNFVLQTGAESLPQMAPGVLLAIPGSIAGPAGAAAGLGLGSFVVDYPSTVLQALQSAGVDTRDPEALKRAFADKALMANVGEQAFRHAVPVSLLDTISGGIAGKTLVPAKVIERPLLRELANIGVQAPVQGTLGATGEALGELNAGQNMQAGNIMAEFFGEFAGTPVEVTTMAGGRLRESLRDALRAKEQQQLFTALADGAASSKLAQRLPAKLQELVARMTKDGPLENVYIPVDAWKTHFQTVGIDPRDAATQILGSPTAYDEARAAGTDLPIPSAAYAAQIAPTEHHAALLPELRVGPQEMNAREVDAWMQTQAANQTATPADSGTQVREDVTGQLLGAGFDQGTAETYAQLYESTFRSLGARLGMDPHALYQQYNLRVSRQLPDVLTKLAKTDNLDVLLNRLRAGDIPKSEDIFGRSLLEHLREFGLQDQGGELSARDLDKARKAFQRSIVRAEGLTLEHAAEKAHDANYIAERNPDALLAAIDRELAGEPVYPAGATNQALADQRALLDELDQYLGHAGIDLSQTDNETIKRLLNNTEPTIPELEPEVANLAAEDKLGVDGTTLYQSDITRGAKDQAPVSEIERAAHRRIAEREAAQRGPEPGVGPVVEDRGRESGDSPGIEVQELTLDEALAAGTAASDPQTNQDIAAAMWRQYGTESAYFRRWFGQSKMVNKAGTPVVFYHGSRFTPELYDPARAGEASGFAASGLGFFITADKSLAMHHGGNVLAGYVKMERPYVLRADRVPDFETVDQARAFAAELRDRGYDGIYIPEAKTGVVFDSAQYKLTNNRGTFDPTDGRFLFQQTPARESVTTTKAFRKWFGDSKVVDAQGQPLVVYHGTDVSFDTFDTSKVRANFPQSIGFHFTDRPTEADIYAGPNTRATDPVVMPVYIRAENPLVIDTKEPTASMEADLNRSEIIDKLVKAKRAGTPYDGIIIRRTHDDAFDGINVIVFDPKQIKSAIGNRGTFDATSPNILEQKGGEIRRGLIQIGGASMSIKLLEKADLSTFLHETGHFYLEVLGDLAQRPDAPVQLRDDYQTVLDWLGVKSRDEIQTEHHERWARAFETYLMEGKSPSTTLTRAFARFRAWMVGIYRTLGRLGADLSDPVRKVMNRLVATDEEIEIATSAQGMQPLFADAQAAGMTPEEFATYQKAVDAAREAAETELATKAMREIRRESEKWWKDARADARKEVEGEVNGQKAYIAQAVLAHGTLPGGDALPAGMHPVKLSRQAIIDTYGESFLKRLPRPYVYTKEGGIHPEMAADLFGFQSGEELLLALANLRPRKALIDAETDARMRERYGDMRLDGSIATDAMRAVHNEDRAQLLMTELRNLAARTKRRVVPLEVLRAEAERIVAAKRVREITPAIYERAEAKAARAAFRAAAGGDYETALAEKQRELLNHELYRAAAKARDDVDAIVEYMSKFGKTTVREKIGKAGGDYLDQIDAILDRFDFRRGVSLRSIDRRKALAAWVTEQNELGYTVTLPQRLLNEAYRQHYKDTSYEELVGIRDAVHVIEHLARTKNKLLASSRTKAFDEARADIVGSIHAHHNVAPEPLDFAPGLKKRIKDGAKGFFAAHTKLEFLFEWLDGNKPLGPVWQHLFKPFAEAEATETKMLRDMGQHLAQIFETYPRKERALWFFKRIHVPEINTALTKANMLAVALNWGNEYNRDALMQGYGWTEPQVQAILDRLDARDWQTVQAIWDYIDSFWPKIEQQERELTGLAPAKVQPAEVQTKHGTFRGGYYPVVFDSKLSWRQAVLEEKAHARDLFGGNWARAMTRHGHTIERQGTGGKPIKLELSGLTEHLTNVVHDLAYRPALIDVGRLVNDKEIREAIEHSVGREYYRQVNPWLVAMAADRRDYANPIEGLLGRARMGATAVNMGWKLTTALTQFLGYTVSIKEIGAKYGALGIADVYKTPGALRQAWDFASSRSEQMSRRRQTFDRDVRDALKRLNVAGVKPGVSSVVDAYTHGVRESFFSFIGYMDLAVSLPTWMGAYRKAMDGAVDNVAGGDEPAAIDYADQVVRETQGAGGAKDLALVQRGPESFRIFTMFYSYFSVLFNQFSKTFHQYRTDRNLPKLVAAAALLWFVPAVLGDLALGRGPGGDAGDDEWRKWLLEHELFYPFQSLILVRDVVNGMGEYGYEPSAAFDMYASIAKAGKLGLNVVEGNKDEITKTDVKGLAMTAGYLFALPARQTWLTLDYLYDWLNGDVNPSNPAEGAWQALVTGHPKK